MSLYKTLGVEPTASQKDIKNAWRAKARALHPDKHPDATYDDKKEYARLFQEAEYAHRVLSDPVARAQYDTTGKVPPLAPDSDAEAARKVITLFQEHLKKKFEEVVHADTIKQRFRTASDSKSDPLATVLSTMKRKLTADIDSTKQSLTWLELGIAQLNKSRGRIRRKGTGENLFSQVLEQQHAATSAALAYGARELAVLEKARALVEDYELMPEAAELLAIENSVAP